ncbi:MAG: type II/IV secretion system ATPase subunit [Thermoproteota archaeon]
MSKPKPKVETKEPPKKKEERAKEPEKKAKKKSKEKEIVEEASFLPIPPDGQLIESYWIKEPYARVHIVTIPERGGAYGYFIEEAQLKLEERKALKKLLDILGKELEPPETSDIDAKLHIINETRRLMKKYRSTLGRIDDESWKKIEYYIERDLIGFGHINVMMYDTKIEDVSCDGVGKPVYVWHRKYESLPSNLTILDRESFNNFIIKLAHFAGKHVSSAFPIVDAMLPGRHRLAATYGEEISPSGSTFTIRKFREEPYSIIDLIELGTINERIAAYFWIALENRLTVMTMGGTGAGKTTFLNALANLFKPGMKIVTVEEIAELNIPHENWVQFISRESYGLGQTKIGSISLFDLVRTSLRYRPDYIIVGEIRGEEAFVLFQAMATGHGGLSTLHAENLDYAIKRLTSPPMNVAPAYIQLMNIAAIIERVYLPKQVHGIPFGRRIRHIWELYKYAKTKTIAEWDPVTDTYKVNVEESENLRDISVRMGKPPDAFLEEISRREEVLRWMRSREIRNVKAVAKVITQYYQGSKPAMKPAEPVQVASTGTIS